MGHNSQKLRVIKAVHRAQRADMPGLATVRALPTASIGQIDPFLFLNHHGPDVFPPNNRGLPFDPHPHRGMQTVTFIVEGDVLHLDNATGDESIIEGGGVQWMVAGKGLLHLETSSDAFKRSGGDVEILQLWINLPAKLKLVEPVYYGLQHEDVPVAEFDDGKVRAKVLAGSLEDINGAIEPLTDVEFYWLDFLAEGIFSTNVSATRNIFCYVVRGNVVINEQQVPEKHLVEFNDAGELLNIAAQEESLVLLGHATPYNEPVVAHGPFVMNTEQEIHQAWQDLREGRFGKWKAR